MVLPGSLSYFNFPLLPALAVYTLFPRYLSGEMSGERIKGVVVPSSQNHFGLKSGMCPEQSHGT